MTNTLLPAVLACAVVAAAATAGPASAEPGPTAPADFVSLSDIDPSILLDIRYSAPHNFTGSRKADLSLGD